MDVTEQFRPRVDVSMICHESSLAQTTGAQLAKAFDHQKQQGSRLLARLQKTDPLFEVCCLSSSLAIHLTPRGLHPSSQPQPRWPVGKLSLQPYAELEAAQHDMNNPNT